MALIESPRFQAAIVEYAELRDKVREALKAITDKLDKPITEGSGLDWTSLAEPASDRGSKCTGEEEQEAFFAGDRELSEQDPAEMVGAGSLFSMDFLKIAPLPMPDPKPNPLFGGDKLKPIGGGLGEDTIHG